MVGVGVLPEVETAPLSQDEVSAEPNSQNVGGLLKPSGRHPVVRTRLGGSLSGP